MNALEKIKLSRESLTLVSQLKAGNLAALEKIKASKRVLEITALLKGQASQPAAEEANISGINPLYQSIIDGAEPTLELLNALKQEATSDPEHPQLKPAVKIMLDKVMAMAGQQDGE